MKRKIKYQGGLTKMICMKLAVLERKKFSELLSLKKISVTIKEERNEFDIISFSGKRDFEEQMLSIYTFLFYIGIPAKWTIYSDGSHTDQDKNSFLSTFPFLEFREWNFNKNSDRDDLLKKYLEVCHLSKKLHVILGHDYERQTIYVDSDVIFYNNAAGYFNSNVLRKGFWYIPETNWGSFKDKGFDYVPDMFALNSGLLILNKEFNFEYVYEYLKSLNAKYEYFSEQSSFNYSFKKQQANILDPRQFIVNLEDQFDFRMALAKNEMAARHYVTPVRHKIWQKGWRWHFE